MIQIFDTVIDTSLQLLDFIHQFYLAVKQNWLEKREKAEYLIDAKSWGYEDLWNNIDFSDQEQ